MDFRGIGEGMDLQLGRLKQVRGARGKPSVFRGGRLFLWAEMQGRIAQRILLSYLGVEF